VGVNFEGENAAFVGARVVTGALVGIGVGM